MSEEYESELLYYGTCALLIQYGLFSLTDWVLDDMKIKEFPLSVPCGFIVCLIGDYLINDEEF